MTRLQAAPDRGLPRGLPEDPADWCHGPHGRGRHPEGCFPRPSGGNCSGVPEWPGWRLRAGAQAECLSGSGSRAFLGCNKVPSAFATVTNVTPIRSASSRCRSVHAGKRLLGPHPGDTESGFHRLEQRLPRNLVKPSTSQRFVLPESFRWIVESRTACQAMAASLLHAAGRDSSQITDSLPLLSGAYWTAPHGRLSTLPGGASIEGTT